VTGSRFTAQSVKRATGVLPSRAAIALGEPNPKAMLLLLCARIGYTPHGSFQR
jgi:hypothetical protein